MSPADVAQGFVNQVLLIIVYPLVVLLLAVAVVVFLYGCFEYVAGASNETKRETGKKHILWGLIGLFVMLSAQAILNLVLATFNITPVSTNPLAPTSAPTPVAAPRGPAPVTAPVPVPAER